MDLAYTISNYLLNLPEKILQIKSLYSGLI